MCCALVFLVQPSDDPDEEEQAMRMAEEHAMRHAAHTLRLTGWDMRSACCSFKCVDISTIIKRLLQTTRFQKTCCMVQRHVGRIASGWCQLQAFLWLFMIRVHTTNHVHSTTDFVRRFDSAATVRPNSSQGENLHAETAQHVGVWDDSDDSDDGKRRSTSTTMVFLH